MAQTYETATNSLQLIHCKSNEMIESDSEQSINERLKFLISKLGLSVRAFSTAIGATDTNTRNYIDRGAKPNAEYLGKLLKRFDDINPTWLLLGEGEPFMEKSNEPRGSSTSEVKNNYGNNVGSNRGGTVTQHQSAGANPSERDTKLALAEREIQHLREQLAAKDALLASKDETIAVLKTAFNRPS